MESYFRYLLLSTLSLSILYISYRLFLKNEVRFRYLRIYLLLSIFVALLLPFSTIEIALPAKNVVVDESLETVEHSVIIPQEEIPVPEETIIKDSAAPEINWKAMLFYLHFVGMAIVILRLIMHLITILLIAKKAKTEEGEHGKVLICRDIKHPFTFLNRIFIPSALKEHQKYHDILTHEKIHASQLHSIDSILIEVLAAVMWFNPLVWMMRKSVQLVHEYLADEGVLSTGADKLRYQALLVNQVAEERLVCLSSGFNHSLIKKRMIMMTKNKGNTKFNHKIWVMLPITAILFIGVSCLNGQQSDNDSGKFTVVIDAGHGAEDPGAETDAGIKEKDITLALANLMQERSSKMKNIQIITLRDKDEFMDLNMRVERINEINPDLLISLHVNKHFNAEYSGIECTIAKESLFETESRTVANEVVQGLLNLDGLKGRSDVYSANLLVLRESNCPGITINLGFLSNEADMNYLINPAKQNDIVDNLLATLNSIETSWEDITSEKIEEDNTVTAVALTKMNILYLGVNNPANIAISGVDPKEIEVEVSNGNIEGENGNYIINARRPGNRIVKVYTVKGGVRTCVDEYEYRVKTVPYPKTYIAGKKGGAIKKEELLKANKVEAVMENFDFDLRFQVTSFVVSTTHGGFVYEASSNNDLLTSRQKEIIQNLEAGNRVYFQDVMAAGPDGTERALPTISFKITE